MIQDHEHEKEIDLSKKQILKYAEDLAALYEREKAQRKALERANRKLQSEVEERRALHEDLQQSEARYRSLFEESLEAIFITSHDGIMLDANDAYLRLFGFGREEIVGQSVLKTYADPSMRSVLQQQIEATGFLERNPVQMRRKDGTTIDCWLSATVRRGREGTILGYQGIVRDMTEHERNRRILELIRKMEALAHMAGGVAHEIRNPLAISSSAAQLLENDNLPRHVRKECAAKIVSGINRASLIIENLLFFSSPLKARNPGEVDLVTVLSKTLDIFTPLAMRQQVEITSHLNQQQLLVMGNAELLLRVFLNLFSNALAAMPDGGSLLVTADMSGNEATVTIADTGRGIPEEHVSRIFDPFFSGFSTSEGGGLGLSVAYSLVAQHGGSVQVDSTVGKGTTFHVKLPLSTVSR